MKTVKVWEFWDSVNQTRTVEVDAMTYLQDEIRAVAQAFKALGLSEEKRKVYKEPLVRLLTGAQDTLRVIQGVYEDAAEPGATAFLGALLDFGIAINNELQQIDPGEEPEAPDFIIDETSIVNAKTGDVKWCDKEQLTTVLGADRISTSAKNREPMVEGPGAVIHVEAGTYASMHRLSRSWPKREDPPDQIIATGGNVLWMPKPDAGDIAVYAEYNGKVHFLGSPGAQHIFKNATRALMKSENPFSVRWGIPHPGFYDMFFRYCIFNGGWDWQTLEGFKGDWGRHDYGIDKWVFLNCLFHNQFDEHEGYSHQVMGEGLTILHSSYRNCGRAAEQIVNRPFEYTRPQPDATGPFTMKHCKIVNTGLNDGASAITVKGHSGQVTLKDIIIKQGCDPDLPDRPYGKSKIAIRDRVTGGLVLEGAGIRKGKKVLIDNLYGEVGAVSTGQRPYKRPFFILKEQEFVELKALDILMHPGADVAIEYQIDTCDMVRFHAKMHAVKGKCRVGDVVYPTWAAMLKAIDGDSKVEVIW